MGSGSRAGESATHERHHDVHVRQLVADIQHYDGVHVVQNPPAGPAADEHGVCQVRDRGHEEYAVDG